MTGLWIFANVVLPLVILAMGYAAMRWDQHQSRD
ncbi:hypothetical protein OCOJLMKI_2172 [Methylobacterium iners]|uniref:Uncharacterized protein n=1 Tax=Methylobacterium iners TaxID=418707 RepID=A0ABQ4RZ56_9HYPH|nr:hypothetical protein OCOJLMKI_2172 [Methylobacterium iners]